MANRSDFFTATLPRQYKKQLAMWKFDNKHERGEVKRLMIEAHKAHVIAKTRRADAPTDSGEE
jgi:hypothetical protein